MSPEMRIGVLTSVETGHRYFVHALRAQFQVVAGGHELTGYEPSSVGSSDLTLVVITVISAFCPKPESLGWTLNYLSLIHI